MRDVVSLSDAELAALGIAPAEVTEAVERAFADKREGRLHVAPKAAVMPGDGRYMMATLAVGPAGTVVKQVTVAPRNPGHGLPSIMGAIMVLDCETGALRAVMEAGWITAVRTAALSDAAAARLADPGSSVIGFVGTGVQARSHLDAFATRFPLRRALIFGRGRANIDALAAACRDRGIAAQVVDDGDAALDGADIVVTSITLDYRVEPFLDAGRLKPTAFAAITDLGIPWHDAALARLPTLVVDDLEQEAAAPNPLVPGARYAGDLAGLVAGDVDIAPGPRAFVFRGIALGDYAAATLALSRATEG